MEMNMMKLIKMLNMKTNLNCYMSLMKNLIGSLMRISMMNYLKMKKNLNLTVEWKMMILNYYYL